MDSVKKSNKPAGERRVLDDLAVTSVSTASHLQALPKASGEVADRLAKELKKAQRFTANIDHLNKLTEQFRLTAPSLPEVERLTREAEKVQQLRPDFERLNKLTEQFRLTAPSLPEVERLAREAEKVQHLLPDFERLNKLTEQFRLTAPSLPAVERLAREAEKVQQLLPDFERLNKLTEQFRIAGTSFTESGQETYKPREIREHPSYRTSSGAPITSLKELGKSLRTERKSMHLSQQELADVAGVGRRFVSELENGKETLEIGRVLMVCQALGVDIVARKR